MFNFLTKEEVRLRLSQKEDNQEKRIVLSDHLVEPNPGKNQSLYTDFRNTIRPAAVLVPLLKAENEWHLLFIRRAEAALDLHSGQVAFPGGGSENHENAFETALREANEEIGLQANDVEILGDLIPIQTVSGYIITPVVSVIPYPYPFKPAASEVSEIFIIPLSWLADPRHYEERDVLLEIPFQGTMRQEPLRVIYYVPYQGKTLWGASARIVHQLLAKLKL